MIPMAFTIVRALPIYELQESIERWHRVIVRKEYSYFRSEIADFDRSCPSVPIADEYARIADYPRACKRRLPTTHVNTNGLFRC